MTSWARARGCLDRIAAAGLLAVTAPLVAVLALLIWLEDRRWPFVAVTRAGRGGDEFSMWKLRSMRADRADGTADGAALTSEGDARITAVGARLRRLHLDELPQLWNVIKGEMCLLGPRPEAPAFVDRADPRWQAVLAMPPGIAGPTQLVVGSWERRVISAAPDGEAYLEQVVPVKLAVDAWYVRRASPSLDLLTLSTLVGRIGPRSGRDRLLTRVLAEVPESRSIGSAPTVATPAR